MEDNELIVEEKDGKKEASHCYPMLLGSMSYLLPPDCRIRLTPFLP